MHSAPGIAILEGDCLKVMDLLIERDGEGQFDLVFADPPYFLSNGGVTCKNGRMTSVNKGDWDASRGADSNHQFNHAWLSRCKRLLKPDGSIWVSGTHHIIFSVGFAMQQLDFRVLNDITWEKPNPPPNLGCRNFTHSTEMIIWAAKSRKSKHFFSYAQMKEENDGKQMKSVWRMSAPSKEEKKHGKHPTQKPIALLSRILAASTRQGDKVLDPFSGSGTTGVACALSGRQFVGIERDASFVDLANARIAEALA